jgi:hypothetical protein
MTFSGEACPTTSAGTDVFNGNYVILSGTGAFSSVSGAGAINGSQTGASGASLAAISGTIQKPAGAAVGPTAASQQ